MGPPGPNTLLTTGRYYTWTQDSSRFLEESLAGNLSHIERNKQVRSPTDHHVQMSARRRRSSMVGEMVWKYIMRAMVHEGVSPVESS